MAFSRDGRQVMLNGTSFRDCMLIETRVHDSATGKPSGPPLLPGGVIIDAAFSPDGKSVCTASSAADTPDARRKTIFEPDGRGGTVQIWDWAAGTRRFDPINLPTEPRGLDYHPDGSLLAVTCADGWVVLVDPADGTIRRTIDTGIRTRPHNANLWWSNGQAKFTPRWHSPPDLGDGPRRSRVGLSHGSEARRPAARRPDRDGGFRARPGPDGHLRPRLAGSRMGPACLSPRRAAAEAPAMGP